MFAARPCRACRGPGEIYLGVSTAKTCFCQGHYYTLYTVYIYLLTPAHVNKLPSFGVVLKHCREVLLMRYIFYINLKIHIHCIM